MDVAVGGVGSDLRVTNSNTKPFSTTGNASGVDGLPLPSEFGESNAPRRFGMNSSTMSPTMIGSGSGLGSGTGGQFSTFPVKGRSNTAGSNATTGGLSLGGDFESSISGALGLGENRDKNTNKDGTPNVTLDGTPWDGSSIPFDPSHNRAQSQESTYLAYNAPAERQPIGGAGASSEPGSTLSVGKGVRFRTPSMEVSGMQPIAPGVGSPMYPGGGSRWRGGGMRSSNDGEWVFEDEGVPWIRKFQE